MPQIIDVILLQSPYSDIEHPYIVVDKMPDFRYERCGQFLLAEDDGFFDCYGFESPSPGCLAFGGRKFDIPMKDGSVVKAMGQWWSVPTSGRCGVRTILCGLATIEKLHERYVFFSGHVSVEKYEAWLANNYPTHGYNKYRKPAGVS